MGREVNSRQLISKIHLDTISIPQIITAINPMAEVLREVQRIGEIALDRNQLKFPLEP
jgi:hypothetical protein